eukprot:gene3822-3682_t
MAAAEAPAAAKRARAAAPAAGPAPLVSALCARHRRIVELQRQQQQEGRLLVQLLAAGGDAPLPAVAALGDALRSDAAAADAVLSAGAPLVAGDRAHYRDAVGDW